MRHFAFLPIMALTLNCWTAAAWAQSAAGALAAPKAEGSVNELDAVAKTGRIVAGSLTPEVPSNDIKAKPSIVDSTARPLPESVRKSVHVDLVSKTSGLEQANSIVPDNSAAFRSQKALSVKTDLNRL